jgi:hypothetical protein
MGHSSLQLDQRHVMSVVIALILRGCSCGGITIVLVDTPQSKRENRKKIIAVDEENEFSMEGEIGIIRNQYQLLDSSCASLAYPRYVHTRCQLSGQQVCHTQFVTLILEGDMTARHKDATKAVCVCLAPLIFFLWICLAHMLVTCFQALIPSW